MLTIPQKETDAMKQAFDTWQLTPEPPMVLAYDSITPYEFAHYTFEVVTNKYFVECLASCIGYYIGRNKEKTVIIKTKSGARYEIKGFNSNEVIEIMRHAREIEITDETGH
jgi:hypothetical protein